MRLRTGRDSAFDHVSPEWSEALHRPAEDDILVRLRAACFAGLLWWLSVWIPPPVDAATNAVFGGIAGVDNGTLVGGDDTGRARFTVNSVKLALIKQARDLQGIVLPNGSDVTPGQEIYFVLLVDNPTSHSALDLRIDDLLDTGQFSYVPASLAYTIVPTSSDDASVWSGEWRPLTDEVGAPDDLASFVAAGGPPGRDRVTVGAALGQANMAADIPAGSMIAVRFLVRVQ